MVDLQELEAHARFEPTEVRFVSGQAGCVEAQPAFLRRHLVDRP